MSTLDEITKEKQRIRQRAGLQTPEVLPPRGRPDRLAYNSADTLTNYKTQIRVRYGCLPNMQFRGH